MISLNGFDATQHDPVVGFAPVPAGRYRAQIIRSEFKPTKVGDGKYLELEFEIAEGEHRGRLVWTRLNLENPSPTAVRLAQQELSAICHAIGVLKPRETGDLEHRVMTITVTVRNRDDGGGQTNYIAAYERAQASSQEVPI